MLGNTTKCSKIKLKVQKLIGEQNYHKITTSNYSKMLDWNQNGN